MKLLPLALLAAMATASIAQPPAEAPGLRLPAVISDNMVLLAGGSDPVWGWTAPGRTVTVSFAGHTAKAKAGRDGRWEVRLKGLRPNETGALEVSDGVQSRTVANVLVGEVWLCSGQSNMAFILDYAQNAADEVKAASYPQIRLFQVDRTPNTENKGDVIGHWTLCTPETAHSFSAVAYFFGRSIHQSTHVPVGLIDSSYGGTPAEAWTSRDALLKVPALSSIMSTYVENLKNSAAIKAQYDRVLAKRGGLYPKEPENTGFEQGWAKPDANESDWKTMNLPGMWEKLGKEMQIDGTVWFRKQVKLPASWEGKDLKLTLGSIDDRDNTYFNGVRVGGLGEETPGSYATPREYVVPGTLVHAGANVIATRVFDTGGDGGYGGKSQEMALTTTDGSATLNISGPWRFKVEHEMEELPAEPLSPTNPCAPTALFEGMIHPLAPFAIRGALWYQGEANAGAAYQYRTLLPTMISCWRSTWKDGNFPFLIVQLANFMARRPDPTESTWAELREAQAMAIDALPNVAVATAVDIGDANDIHPKNKQEVGRRLAMAARMLTYKMDAPQGHSPLYAGMKNLGDRIVVRFKYGQGLKTAERDMVRGFAIAGADGKFVWAKASIRGDEVVVWSDSVAKPVAVRYGWADNPELNLVNGLGLPVLPFRTDSWPGLTGPQK